MNKTDIQMYKPHKVFYYKDVLKINFKNLISGFRTRMKTFAANVIQFNSQIHFSGKLPHGIRVMNPFRDNEEILPVSSAFYKKFYNDKLKRRIILGINPGRLGAGATGIPFTDTKRLAEICDIKMASISTHEPSSVFMYDVIEKYGGAKNFYSDYYIHSICPLGFVKKNNNSNWVNCNYYDYPALFLAVKNFIITNLKKQIAFGVDTDTCFVVGKKNAKFFNQINEKEKLFRSVVIFDHPRFIEQYKSKERMKYISYYAEKLKC